MSEYGVENYGYIYITTNLVNGKKYIGKHKSPVFDPNYKGSGKHLHNAISKYGWDNFSTVIVSWHPDKDSLDQEERRLIEKYDAVNSSEFYNLKQGGDGGWDCSPFWRGEMTGDKNPNYGRRYRLNLSESQRSIRSLRLKGNKYGSLRSLDSRKKMSERFTGEGNPFYGKKHTEETKKLISEGRSGDKNPSYRKVWMTNSIVDRRVSEEDVPEMIKQGFVRGRKVSDSTRKKMSETQSKRSRDEKGRWI